MHEGPEYRSDALETAGNYVFDDDEIVKASSRPMPATSTTRAKSKKTPPSIQQGYRDSGYVNARVTPQVTLDRENKTTHVVHRVEEGDLKYIQEVKITGNYRDERRSDPARSLAAHPGERFDGTLIRRQPPPLENTKYFDTIRLTLEDIEDSDQFANLLVDVEEGKTGNV